MHGYVVRAKSCGDIVHHTIVLQGEDMEAEHGVPQEGDLGVAMGETRNKIMVAY